jgi:putative ABC transport system substrate-binding protein
MRRREFITLLGGAAAAWPRAVRAEQVERMRRIGVLMGWADNDPTTPSLVATFRDALAKLGWTEGKNLRIELRWGNGNATRIDRSQKSL